MTEKRMAERYNVEKLPENLKSFLLDTLQDKDFMAETYDASSIGIGLSVPNHISLFSLNDHIVLKSLDDDFRLVGQIRYVHDRGSEGCRIGIEFKQSKSLALYRSLLEPVVQTV